MVNEVVAPVQTLSFEEFWGWVTHHRNCIIRAGTLDTVINDYDDYHWHFGEETDDRLYVQMLRGKRIVAELVIRPEEISFVQCQSGEQEQYFFDLYGDQQQVLCYFVLCHSFDEAESLDAAHWN